MKTLPEILGFNGYGYCYEHDDCGKSDCLGTKANHDALEAIAKELMGCLPEKLEIPDNWRVLRPELVDQYEANNSVVDEVRARLTAFIKEEKK